MPKNWPNPLKLKNSFDFIEVAKPAANPGYKPAANPGAKPEGGDHKSALNDKT